MKKLFAANFLHVTLIGSTATGFISLALIDASIKSVILLLLAATACFALVRASAATRHLVWAATMLGLLLMPACALLLPNWRVLPEWLSLENGIEIKEPPTQQLVLGSPISIDSTEMHEFAEAREGEVVPHTAFSLELESVGSIPNPLETSTRPSELGAFTNSSPDPFQIRLPVPLVLGVWASGFLVCFFPAVVSFFRLRSLERKYQTNQPLSAKSVRLIAKVANNLGVAQPRVFVGPAGTMPMVWSFRHSRLLVPSDIDHWSESKAKAIVLHELVHLRRHDPLVCSLGLLARALNWFNPLAWYAVHRLRMECEQACDDQVLQQGIEASDYASHLLELSTFVRFESRTLPLALAIATRPSVESRIASILDETQNRRGVTTARVFAMFVAVSIGVAILASTATRVVSEELTQEDSELFVANEPSAEKAETSDREEVIAEDVEDDVVDNEFIAPLLDRVPLDKPVDSSGTIRKQDHEKFSYVDLSLEECISHAIVNSKAIRTSSESKISESTFAASEDASTAELGTRSQYEVVDENGNRVLPRGAARNGLGGKILQALNEVDDQRLAFGGKSKASSNPTTPTTRSQLVNRTPVVLERVNGDISIRQFEERILNLVRDVEFAYWDLYAAYYNVATARTAMESAAFACKIANAKFKDGGQASNGEAQATVTFHQFKAQLDSALAGGGQGNDPGLFGREQSQQTRSSASQNYIRAVTEYNKSLVEIHAIKGSLLEYNNLELKDALPRCP